MELTRHADQFYLRKALLLLQLMLHSLEYGGATEQYGVAYTLNVLTQNIQSSRPSNEVRDQRSPYWKVSWSKVLICLFVKCLLLQLLLHAIVEKVLLVTFPEQKSNPLPIVLSTFHTSSSGFHFCSNVEMLFRRCSPYSLLQSLYMCSSLCSLCGDVGAAATDEY